MVEFLLLILAVVIGLGLGKALNVAGARGALPASMQRSYDRNNHRVVADRDRRVMAAREHERV